MAPEHAHPETTVRRTSTWRELLERLRVRQLSAQRRVLYVDCDCRAAAEFRLSARACGAMVDIATDPIEAFSHCVEFVYDAVVLSTSPGLADKLVEPVRALQTSTSIVLLQSSNSTVALVPPNDPGIVGVLNAPYEEEPLHALLQRAFALSDTRLEWGSSVRTSMPVGINVLFVGPERERALIAEHLRETPTGSPITLHAALSLHQAAKRLEEHPIDAIVTTLTLPDARGLDSVVAFSEGPRAKPVLVVAEHRDEPLVAQLLRHGAHEFLTINAIAQGRLPEALTNALDRHRATERVAHLAHHDPLTELPNRSLFEQRLRASLSRAARKREQLAVLYIDLDNFKPINDHYGHEAGDRVLQCVAKRLTATIRDYDTAARLGGDEFAIVLNSLEQTQEAHNVAERIRRALNEPIRVGSTELTVSCSVGIATFPESAKAVESLLRAADQAMYRVKRTGRNGVTPLRPALRLLSPVDKT